MNTPTYTILIHYSEIALKKNNRSFFENFFINNIKKHLKNLSFSNIKLSAARVFINNVDLNKWEDYSDEKIMCVGIGETIDEETAIASNSDIETIVKYLKENYG